MFGYVRPASDRLTAEQQRYFEGAYCGLCHALGSRYGMSGRMILNYDLVFLAMLLSDGRAGGCTKRCVIHPVKGRACACGDSAFDLAADLGLQIKCCQRKIGRLQKCVGGRAALCACEPLFI